MLHLKLLNNGFRSLKFRDKKKKRKKERNPHTQTHNCAIFLFFDFFLSVSLTDAQNEDVVKQFLNENAAGRVFVI